MGVCFNCISLAQQMIIPPTASAPLALYVHWPWCLKKCPYCDFNSHTAGADATAFDRYLACLVQEIKALPWNLHGTHPLVSVFFGGGTPSLMGGRRVGVVLDTLRVLGVLDTSTEVTVECNPTSSSPHLMHELRAAGVNRVSIGVQGMRDNALAFLGREHNAKHAFETLDAAQTIIGNVNADIIYGLPDQQLDEWLQLLGHLASRRLAHISAYQLTIEKNTAFYSAVKRGAWSPLDSDSQADFFEATQQTLQQHGYTNYEISNFALPAQECRHNLHIWRYGTYWGVGAGAHGRPIFGNQVFATANPKLPSTYMEMIEREQPVLPKLADRPPHRPASPNLVHSPQGFYRQKPIFKGLAAQEAFMMGLRLREGVHQNTLEKLLINSSDLEPFSLSGLRLMETLGLLNVSDTSYQLTARGWPLLDTVLKECLHDVSG